MKINSAEIIKTMRKEMGLNQEELAEQLFISVRQLARIESGEARVDMWQLLSTLELLGNPTEDYWLLYLDSDEYSSYKDYKRLKRKLTSDDWSDVKSIIADIEKGPLIKQPVIQQFVSYMKTVDETCMKSDEALGELLKAMHMSKPNFEEDKISEYRMTYNEMLIALGMAESLAVSGEHSRAIAMVQSMINSRENARVSEEDKAILLPSLYYVLALVLKMAGKYKEALNACDNAVEICREYNNLRKIPEMLFCMADCYHKMGEEEHVYKTHLVRAYHVAYGIGRNKAAATIKADALKHYGVTI